MPPLWLPSHKSRTLSAITSMISLPTYLQGHHRTSLALAGWIGVIIGAGILPLQNFVGHPHWELIQWTIPAQQWTARRFYFDVVANVILFLPLGLLLTRLSPSSTPEIRSRTLGIGLLLSAGIEGFQIFCHNRHPSIYDIMTNLAGTWIGVRSSAMLFSFRFVDEWLPASHSLPPARRRAPADSGSRTA